MKISLRPKDTLCLRRCAVEARGDSYPISLYETFVGTQNENFWTLIIKAIDDDLPLDLSKEDWLIVFKAVNAVIYDRGPEDLFTLTGYDLSDVTSLNLHIHRALTGGTIYTTWDN